MEDLTPEELDELRYLCHWDWLQRIAAGQSYAIPEIARPVIGKPHD